tara:strand:+ start:514 stop:1731 length:1218 start_codon:yes stop_codon:yes gene_type:complete
LFFKTDIKSDAKILSLVSAGHFVSHFMTLTLPPLFPFLQADFSMSYTELGFIMTLFALSTGIFQIPIGFLVDRIGAFCVLLIGLSVLCLSIGAIGFSNSQWTLGALVILAGIANSVFHPADYAVLTSVIKPVRLGKAFGVHTFAGHLGNAIAPITIIYLALAWSWRIALVFVSAVGLVIMVCMFFGIRNNDIDSNLTKENLNESGGLQEREEKNSIRIFFSIPLLKLFVFFVLTAAASNGMQTFSVSALVALFDTPIVTASASLTAFLFATSVGILLGGVLADYTGRHDLIAAVAFGLTAIIIGFIGAVPFSSLILILLLTIAGLLQGVIRPARDMLVHAAAPAGETGKVFGFVTTGINVGAALMPLILGWLVDRGAVRWVFWLIALSMVLALLTVLTTKNSVDN